LVNKPAPISPSVPAGATRFWLLRHAVVSLEARAFLYGTMDVPICLETSSQMQAAYRALAQRLPTGAAWYVTPLSRTRHTADAIAGAGYDMPEPGVEPDLTEQDLGEWQGLPHAALPALLREPAHAFWPLGATEKPPGGESMVQVVHRVGHALERLAATHVGQDVVAVSHGGAIRGALAHATGVGAHAALHFSVQNLSLTVLERFSAGWRVVCVNETGPG
jgi:alpha-ribazole phosphatase